MLLLFLNFWECHLLNCLYPTKWTSPARGSGGGRGCRAGRALLRWLLGLILVFFSIYIIFSSDDIGTLNGRLTSAPCRRAAAAELYRSSSPLRWRHRVAQLWAFLPESVDLCQGPRPLSQWSLPNFKCHWVPLFFGFLPSYPQGSPSPLRCDCCSWGASSPGLPATTGRLSTGGTALPTTPVLAWQWGLGGIFWWLLIPKRLLAFIPHPLAELRSGEACAHCFPPAQRSSPHPIPL